MAPVSRPGRGSLRRGAGAEECGGRGREEGREVAGTVGWEALRGRAARGAEKRRGRGSSGGTGVERGGELAGWQKNDTGAGREGWQGGGGG